MRREDFVLYDVVCTEGTVKGMRCNHTPMNLEEATKLAQATSYGKPVVVPTEDKAWEDYVYLKRVSSGGSEAKGESS